MEDAVPIFFKALVPIGSAGPSAEFPVDSNEAPDPDIHRILFCHLSWIATADSMLIQRG